MQNTPASSKSVHNTPSKIVCYHTKISVKNTLIGSARYALVRITIRRASEILSGVTNGNQRYIYIWYVQDTIVARAGIM